MAFTKVAPAGIGSTPGDGYRIGDSFLHSTGVEITNINATGILTAASLDISGAIDFDGHTELDNVNISGVSTFVGTVNLSTISSAASNLSIHNTADRVLIKGANRIDIADDMVRFQNRAQNAALLEAVGGASGYVKLYQNNSVKLETTNTGAVVSGILTATSFSGLLPISNAGNDYVLTSAGGSGVINAEANLSMTGNILTFNTTANTHRIQNVATGNHYTVLEFDSNRSSAGDSLAFIDFQWDGTKVADIQVIAGSDTTNKDDGHIAFRTSPAQGSIAERLRIASNGNVSIGNNPTVHSDTIFHVEKSSGETNVKFEGNDTMGARLQLHNNKTTGTGLKNQIDFCDAGGQSTSSIQGFNTDQTNNLGELVFATRSAQGSPPEERLRITSTGNVQIGGNYGSNNLGKLSVDGTLGVDDGGSGTSVLNIMTSANSRFKLLATSSLAQILTQNNVYFAIKTDAGTGSGTERLRIDTSGQMGLGVVPNSNWPSNNDFKALQIGTGACVFGRGSGDEDRGGIAVNWYSDGSNNKYIGNGNAARIYLADGNMYFSNAANNTSGANAAMTLEDRVIIDTTGNIQIKGTNHATMYYRDDGARYGSIFYDGSNFVTRMPAGDNYQVELIDGTVHTRFNNVNGQSGSGSMLELYGGDNTYLYVRGGTETKPSIYMGGGDYGVDNSRIGARYNLSFACNEDGNQTGRKIVFYDDDIELARMVEDNQGTSSAQGCMQTTGPGAIRDYYDMRNINLEGTTFDYVSNDSDGGGTSFEIKNGSVIRLYSTSGGHGGNWMRPVYIRQNGYYYWRCNVRLTTTCGAIHPSTSTNNYKYPIMFRFRMHGSGSGSQCKVELNQHYATSGTCNGNQTGTGSLADGTYVTRTGDAVYLTAGTYQPRYFTNGYLGVRELHIYELALIQCGSSTSGA